MKSLNQIKEEMLAKNKPESVGEIYYLRVPAPEKEEAKKFKCKWNEDKMLYELKTPDIDNHPLRHLRADSPYWMRLKREITKEFQADLKLHGVVKSLNKETNEWESWILINGKYESLIDALTELELL